MYNIYNINVKGFIENRKKKYVGNCYSYYKFVSHDLKKEIIRTKQMYTMLKRLSFTICDCCKGSGLVLDQNKRLKGYILWDCKKCNALGLLGWTDNILRGKK